MIKRKKLRKGYTSGSETLNEEQMIFPLGLLPHMSSQEIKQQRPNLANG